MHHSSMINQSSMIHSMINDQRLGIDIGINDAYAPYPYPLMPCLYLCYALPAYLCLTHACTCAIGMPA